jgi:hypothetical protein
MVIRDHCHHQDIGAVGAWQGSRSTGRPAGPGRSVASLECPEAHALGMVRRLGWIRPRRVSVSRLEGMRSRSATGSAAHPCDARRGWSRTHASWGKPDLTPLISLPVCRSGTDDNTAGNGALIWLGSRLSSFPISPPTPGHSLRRFSLGCHLPQTTLILSCCGLLFEARMSSFDMGTPQIGDVIKFAELAWTLLDYGWSEDLNASKPRRARPPGSRPHVLTLQHQAGSFESLARTSPTSQSRYRASKMSSTARGPRSRPTGKQPPTSWAGTRTRSSTSSGTTTPP